MTFVEWFRKRVIGSIICNLTTQPTGLGRTRMKGHVWKVVKDTYRSNKRKGTFLWIRQSVCTRCGYAPMGLPR